METRIPADQFTRGSTERGAIDQGVAVDRVREAVLGVAHSGRQIGFSQVVAITAGVVLTGAALVPLDVSVRGVGLTLSKAGSGPLVAGVSGRIDKVTVPVRGAAGEGQVLATIKSDGDTTVAGLEQRITIAETRAGELEEFIAYLRTGRSSLNLPGNSEYQAWLAREASFDARAATAEQVIASSAEAVQQSQRGLTLAQERLTTQRDLAARGLLARSRLYDYELLFTDANRSHETARSALAQARLVLESTHRERDGAKAELIARMEAEQRALAERLQELKSSLASAALSKGNTTVSAPQAGYVEAVEPLYVGKNVEAGAALYNLTPVSEDFVLRVSVSNKDVGYVSVGDRAWVRLPSLGGGKFRRLKAEVVRVSEEAVPQPAPMLMLAPEARRAPEFVVLLELLDATPGDTLRLRAGMYAEAEIAVQAKRSAVGFLAESITARGLRPLREP